jgi:hypothetical protein
MQGDQRDNGTLSNWNCWRLDSVEMSHLRVQAEIVRRVFAELVLLEAGSVLDDFMAEFFDSEDCG